MKLSRRMKSDNTEQMLDAFQNRIEQLGGDVNVTSSTSIACTTYVDEQGVLGEVGATYTDHDLMEIWESEHEGDPSMMEYDSYDDWYDDTIQWLKEVDEDVYGGCHGTSTKSSETEIDEDLEDVTGEEDLMEELDSEFIESSDDIEWSFDPELFFGDPNDLEQLYEVVDKYNANSTPVSGDWDAETADEQQAIADAFDITLDDAKAVMIKILGFPEDDAFIGASTNINADYNIYSGYDDIEDVSWEMVDTKSVRDSDGFMTDYTLYHNTVTDQWVCVFGDRDIYTPGEGYYDWEGDSEEEAYEWFESYDTDTLFDD